MELVNQYGKAWSKISKTFGTRNGKQIRDRYINVLDPQIKKGKLTEEEDVMLIQLFHEHGSKWAAIAKYYPNRTADMVKNHFHSSIKKRLGVENKIDNHQKVYERELLKVQVQNNQKVNYFESLDLISKACTSASAKTLAKSEPEAEVEKLFDELLFHHDNENKNQNNFNNDNYGDEGNMNMNNFFSGGYNNNPFYFMKIEEPIASKDELEWNFDDYFIYN